MATHFYSQNFFLFLFPYIIVRLSMMRHCNIALIQLIDYKLSDVTVKLLHSERTINVKFSSTARKILLSFL